jgi:hypothetical protein
MSLNLSRARTALAAIALLSLLASAAHAERGTEEARNNYRTTTQVSRPMPSPPAARNAVTAPQSPSFPEGSSDYHGSNGG